MRAPAGDLHILRAADVIEPAPHAGRVGVALVGNEHLRRGLPGEVRIRIGGDIHAALARRLHQGDGLVGFAPYAHGAQLDVRDLHRHLALLTNGDGFADGVHGQVGLVANVRRVNAALGARGARHGDHFVGGRVAPHFVLEAGAEAEGAFVHGLGDQRSHPGHFVGGRLAFVVVANDLAPDGGVPREGDHVHGGRFDAQPLQVLANRPRRAAVGADRHGGDALRDLRDGGGFDFHAGRRVVVRVDEPRGEHHAGAIDDRLTRACGDGAYVSDGVALHAHAGGTQWGAGAVGNTRPGNDEGGGLALGRCRRLAFGLADYAGGSHRQQQGSADDRAAGGKQGAQRIGHESGGERSPYHTAHRPSAPLPRARCDNSFAVRSPNERAAVTPSDFGWTPGPARRDVPHPCVSSSDALRLAAR